MTNFPTAYQSVIYKTRYSKWLEEENRREEWPETVGRYVDFMFDRAKDRYGFDNKVLKEQVRTSILNLEVMPSMRALMTAGPALDRSNIAGFNCSFRAIDEPIAFDEVLYILMNGTGVGFSVEKKYVDKLPVIPASFEQPVEKHVVGDSKEGWGYALRYVISELYEGRIPDWSTYYVRPAGARLKTFGGRASGPEPLNDLFNFVVMTFVNAAGRKLTRLECHELVCKIAEIVVVGGVRRAALISLSDLSDEKIRDSKSGAWWEEKGHLRLSNNSVAYYERPTDELFWQEWNALRASGSGERGIFNMKAAQQKAASFGRDPSQIAGTNPCGEILLRNKGFCNLSSVTIKPTDTFEDIRERVYIATVIGTLQSTLTDFPYLSEGWRENAEEERLLGVSLNGVFNNPLFYERGQGLEERLRNLRGFAVSVNRNLAHKLGVSPSQSITCNKPDGTTSQLCGTCSGMHPHHSKYFYRSIRGDKKDPVSELLKFAGVHHEDDVMSPDSTDVFTFPIKAPEAAVTRDDLTAIEHLELWLTYAENWTHHNPSVTINVREHEWDTVGKWVFEHFDRITGVSFLPYSDHNYKQAPYEEVDSEQYEDLLKTTPESIEWENLQFLERHDTTTSAQEMSCVSGGCELVNI